MCGYINREIYYANCSEYDVDTLIGSKTIGSDGSVQWRDGIVSQWLRNGGILFLDEYNFMRGEVRGRLHEVLDSVLRGTGTVTLTENHGESIKVHKECRLIAAQNEPGNATSDRQVLDPPQITRFVYIKEVDDLPPEVKLARALGAVGKNKEIELWPEDALRSPCKHTPLRDIPLIEELIVRYIEFANSIQELVKTHQIGKDQPQPVYFSAARDQARVFSFIEEFYDGDPNTTMKRALRFYFKNRFTSEADRTIVENLISLVAVDISKIPLPLNGGHSPAALTGFASPPLKSVKKILGSNFYGPDEWRAQGVEVGTVPPLPPSITRTLLQSPCPFNPGKAIKDTHVLILIPEMLNGEPCTIAKIAELFCKQRGLHFDSEPGMGVLKQLPWALAPYPTSEWILFPDTTTISDKEMQFINKTVPEQQQVHNTHYGDYREVKTLEAYAAIVLPHLTNKSSVDRGNEFFYWRCEEVNDQGGRFCVGLNRRPNTSAPAALVVDHYNATGYSYTGLALARITPTPMNTADVVRKELGKNFLGAEEWWAQGIDTGEVPPIPSSITKTLLNSPCPLHTGQKIKDTHLLVLVPKTVNGEQYTSLKLNDICAAQKGSGGNLVFDGVAAAVSWKTQPWASIPQMQSEWVLIPKCDPDPKKVTEDKHFRSKSLAAQLVVHNNHYNDYREAKTIEVMTSVLLYNMTHKERLLPKFLRCTEPNSLGGRVCVGFFGPNGLRVINGNGPEGHDLFGRALVRNS